MKNDIYVLKNGKLGSDGNTIVFVDEDGKKYYKPVNSISAIYCFGNIALSGFFINLALKRNIRIHFFTKYGTYKGSLINQPIYDGKLIINMVKVINNQDLKIKIGKQIIKGMKSGFLAFLKKYEKTNLFFNLVKNVNITDVSMNSLTGYESTMWRYVYDFLKMELIDFDGRNFHPPKDRVNAVISFLNSLIYSYIMSVFREIELLPELGIIHSAKYKRFSLVLDFADLFKPPIMLPITYELFKFRKIDESAFKEEKNAVYLNDLGRIIVIEEFKKRLKKIFYYKKLKRRISVKSLIKYELLKFKTSIINESYDYVSFKDWEKCM